MDPLSVLAAGGIRSRMESLDLLANNLANASTTGYKVDREFYTLFTGDREEADEEGIKSTVPLIDKRWTDFSQGVLQTTGNPVDMALQGKGFFTVNGPSGPLYTRNGSFQVSPAGILTSADGYPVRSRDGKTIKIDSALPLEVTPDGNVQQGGATIGELDVVNFADTMSLSKQANNYYQNGNPKVAPTAATDVQVHQGQLEASNVNTPASAVQLVGVMRQFEMLQKAIKLSMDMDQKGISEVARIPS
jgi:flagellar basal-body rod protein FlgF